jgi:hypothetical protein
MSIVQPNFSYQNIIDITNYINMYRARNQAPPLQWDNSITSYSQNWCYYMVSSNIFQHSGTSHYGENISFFEGYGTDQIKLIKLAIDSWYNEIALYDFNNPGYSNATGHFTCLVWLASTTFGIGISINMNTGAAYICFNTYPPGNIIGEFDKNVLPLIYQPVPEPVPETVPQTVDEQIVYPVPEPGYAPLPEPNLYPVPEPVIFPVPEPVIPPVYVPFPVVCPDSVINPEPIITPEPFITPEPVINPEPVITPENNIEYIIEPINNPIIEPSSIIVCPSMTTSNKQLVINQLLSIINQMQQVYNPSNIIQIINIIIYELQNSSPF